MYYPPNTYPTQYKEDPRIAQLRQDNLQLQKALKQLNECYQEKIALLEDELRESKRKEEALLEWKSNYIDRELFNNSKYEHQLQKLVKMMQEMALNYQNDNADFKKTIEQKDEEITHLRDQNAYLRQERDSQQQKIQSLAQKYIIEIERLNAQLKQLKEEVEYEEDQQGEVSSCLQGTSHLSIQGQQLYAHTEQHENPSIIQAQQVIDDKEQEDVAPNQIVSQSKHDNSLRDISNKNPGMSQPGQKATFLNGAITIQSQLIS